MILGASLALLVLVPLLRLLVRRERRSPLWVALLAVIGSYGAILGALWALAFLTQRDLPLPCVTNPREWLVVAAGPIALAFGLFLRSRARLLQILFAEAGLIIASLALNYHASFGEDAIRIRPALGFTEHVYTYERVRSVKFVTHFRMRWWGNDVVPRACFVVELDGGERWTSRDGGLFRPPIFPHDTEALELVAARSHRMLQNILTDERP